METIIDSSAIRARNAVVLSWSIDFVFLCIILGTLFFILLGVRPLFVPDEGRYAEIAREMAVSGNYVTPYLNHIKYFEKPVLFYWLGAAAIKTAGLNLWSLRSINAIFALLGCLFTYGIARQLYNRQTGLLAAGILATSLLYFVMAHMISLDLPVTFFITASLYAFLMAIQSPPGRKRQTYLLLAAASAGLAVLTKGLIGLLFPGMIIVTWIGMLGHWTLLKRLSILPCLLLFLAITAPWHLLVGYHNPEFFYFYFIQQHFLRYTTKAIGHYQPFWFFIPYLILGFFPWIVFLPQAISKYFSWHKRHEHPFELFFLLWALLIFFFFSCSASKLIPYILPVFPPLAILTARYLQQAIVDQHYRGIKVGVVALTAIAVMLGCALYIVPNHIVIPDPLLAKRYLTLAAAVLTVGAALTSFYAFRHNYKMIITLFSSTWLFFILLIAAIPSIDARTIAPLAAILKPIITPHDDVIAYNQYYQDLPFYLERPVSVLNWHNELMFGMQHQRDHDWMIQYPQFWQRWHSQQRVFVVMSHSEYQLLRRNYPEEKTYLLGKTLQNVLISNQR